MAKKTSRKAKKSARSTGDVIKATWESTLTALTEAEEQVAGQIQQLLKRNKISAKDAGVALKDLRSRFDKERKKASKELESRLGVLQAQVQKEGKRLGAVVGDAVHGALATFNIPSRREVVDLTKKVDELSKKIDGFRKVTVARTRKVVRRASVAVPARSSRT